MKVRRRADLDDKSSDDVLAVGLGHFVRFGGGIMDVRTVKRTKRESGWLPRTIEESIDYQIRCPFKGRSVTLSVPQGTWPPDPPILGVPVIRSPFELFIRRKSDEMEMDNMRILAPDWVKNDPEWRSALYLLDSPLLRSKHLHEIVDFERREIRFHAVEEESKSWSHGEQLLFRAARDLFNGDGHTDFGDLVRYLDDAALALVLQAIKLRRSI